MEVYVVPADSNSYMLSITLTADSHAMLLLCLWLDPTAAGLSGHASTTALAVCSKHSMSPLIKQLALLGYWYDSIDRVNHLAQHSCIACQHVQRSQCCDCEFSANCLHATRSVGHHTSFLS